MNAKIDFSKSVRRRRLIYLGTRKQRFLLSIRHFTPGILALLFCLSLVAFTLYSGPDPVSIALMSLPALLVIISMLLQNKLAKAKSSWPLEDQTAIIRFLLHKYPGVIRHNCSEQIIIITRPRKSLLIKEFLILQDGEHIYMNISLYSKGDLKYMFFSIPQYITSRAILKKYRRTVLRSAAATHERAQAIV
ncbi:MAG: hypothetical protein J0H74_26475 [Chitinophagaceae bacterium]|nr:hypothetical protein [Chitinophagaceae bacterium]